MRRASDNDIRIYTLVQNLLPTLSYRDAVFKVASDLELTVSAVYGMSNRAKGTLKTEPTSTQFDGDGKVVSRWVKSKGSKGLDRETLLNDAIKTVARLIEPRETTFKREPFYTEFLSLYPLADLHLGLLSSYFETGKEWNLEDSLRHYRYWFDLLIDGASGGANAIIANLGDFTHVDNLINRTPKSGASLDVSHRYRDIVNAAMELSVYLIDRVASKHDSVKVVWLSGNHDETTGIVMQAAIKQLYKNDGRVSVVEPRSRFHVEKFHGVALGFTHGDTTKPEQLPLLMATDYPTIWGSTSYRVWHTGHIHHKMVQEFPGCTVESHNSPAPKDNWHYEKGYRSNRTIQRIDYSDRSEIGRQVIKL